MARWQAEIMEQYDTTTDPEELATLREELFWCALTRGISSDNPTASLLRLFADIKGWTKTGGESAIAESDRIDPDIARSLFASFINSSGDDAP